MAKHWNDHLNDIRLEDSGNYNYRGAYYVIQEGDNLESESELKSNPNLSRPFILNITAVAILSLLSSVIGGMFPATGAMDTWYVLLPFGATIVISGFLTYYSLRLSKSLLSGEPSLGHRKGFVREYVYDKTWPRIGHLSKALIIASILTLVAEAIHLMVYGKGEHFTGAVILLVLVAFSGILGGLLLHRYNAIKWRKTGV